MNNTVSFTPKTDTIIPGTKQTKESPYFNSYVQGLYSRILQGLTPKVFYKYVNFCIIEKSDGKILIIYYDKITAIPTVLLYKLKSAENVYITDDNPLQYETEGKTSLIQYDASKISPVPHLNWIVKNEIANRDEEFSICCDEKIFQDWIKNVAYK